MTKSFFTCFLTIGMLCSFTSPGDNLPKDYFSVPGISFNNAQYHLSWSAHPSPTYFKQEYLTGGEQSASFHKMVMIEILAAAVNTEDIVKNKIAELAARKQTDP